MKKKLYKVTIHRERTIETTEKMPVWAANETSARKQALKLSQETGELISVEVKPE